jgi:hypothetical protein
LATKELPFHSLNSHELFSVNAGIPVDEAEAFADVALSTAVELLDRVTDGSEDEAFSGNLTHACKLLVELGNAVYASLLVADADVRVGGDPLAEGLA